MLFAAIRQGNEQEVRDLLAADPGLFDSRTPEGATPALWALYTGHGELAPLVLGSREPDLYEACALGLTSRVAELVGTDPHLINTRSGDGFPALGLACFFRRPETVALLLGLGADPDFAASNALGVAPLH